MKPPPAHILITGTNIWFDLKNGGDLYEIFKLPYSIAAPDFIQHEIRNISTEELISSGFKLHSLNERLMLELYQLYSENRRSSVIDLAAFIAARELRGILLSGDNHLRKFAISRHVQIHGVLWLLDEMVRYEILSKIKAASALEDMVSRGARLPVADCVTRIKTWTI